MDYLPINIDLKGQPVLVFGAGEVAKRKITMLLKAGARITCIGLRINPAIVALKNKQKITLKIADLHEQNKYIKAEYLKQFRLVISATDDAQLSERIYQTCDQHHVLINTVDDQQRCNYITPAIVDRNPVLVAISSGGSAPILAKQLKTQLEQTIPHKLGLLAAKAQALRPLVKQKIKSFLPRKQFWQQFFNSRFASDILQGKVSTNSEQIIEQLSQSEQIVGEVALVGAGPGDPELLTIKALQSLQQADVVFYDRLVSPEILELIRKDAELIGVGKSAGHHSVPQDQINELLIKHAQQGKKVVRLKGGDPFVFGRGGEELQALKQQHIPFRIVPGITAAVGCSAYAGIPLTHRDLAQNVLFVTGHCKNSIDTLDWPSLAREQQTIAVYMGLLKSVHLSSQLIKHGKNPNTPVALIENGTSETQRVFTTVLKDLADTVEQNNIASPTLIVIGEVAALAEDLAWFNPDKAKNKKESAILKTA